MKKVYWVTKNLKNGDYFLWPCRPKFDGWVWDVRSEFLCAFCEDQFHALTDIRLIGGAKGIIPIHGFKAVRVKGGEKK